jgi:hypothetical protein
VAILNLLRLAEMTGRPEFRHSAERALAAFAPRLAEIPLALPQMLAASEFYLGEPRQIVLAGERNGDDTKALIRALHTRFVPNHIVLLVDSEESRKALAAGIPAIESMGTLDGRAAAYVCRNYTCQLPVVEAEQFIELLQ